jgi:flagellar hook-basal body complex protein FliE
MSPIGSIGSFDISSMMQNPEQAQALSGAMNPGGVGAAGNLQATNALGGGVSGVGFESGAMTQAMNSALSAAQAAGANGAGAITTSPDSTISPLSTPGAGAGDFTNVLQNAVDEVNGKMQAADAAKTGLLTGDTTNVHQAMIAMQESNISLSLMVEVRNKLVESYQELMRMQV